MAQEMSYIQHDRQKGVNTDRKWTHDLPYNGRML